MACALYQRRMFPAAANWTPEPTYSGRPRRAGRSMLWPSLGTPPFQPLRQSVKRISFSLQTSKASASLLLPPSKVAATETVQPFSLGSLTAVRPLGASGFESVAVCSSALMTSPVTVFALALTTVTAPGGPFWTGLGFGGAGPDGAAASPVQNRARWEKGCPTYSARGCPTR